MTQDEMADAKNGQRNEQCCQGIELRSEREQERAGEEAANSYHGEQAALRKYIKKCAVSLERSWKQPVVGDIRLLKMRAWPEPERSGLQPST
jgi:hypothetical protein